MELDRWGRGALGVTCAMVCTLAVPWFATAGDTEHPPTPVLWPEAETCVLTVDRTVDPVLHIDYDIPFEDTLKTGHEVEDSRTHQFLALCRQYPHGHPPPKYLTVADLERAIETENEIELELDNPEATMETHPDWADCFARINADDERLPITYESSDAGIDWDTSEVEPGVYQVVGYTWEPPRNIFVRAPFAVRVTDGEAGAPTPVAVAPLDVSTQTLLGDDTLELEPCVDLGDQPSDGLELRGRWALATDAGDASAWQTFAQVPLSGSTTSLPFAPPEASHGFPVVLAADVVDAADEPVGPAAHGLRELIVILPQSGDDMGDTGDTGDDTAGQDDDASAGGCRITAGPPSLPYLLALCALPLAVRRRHAASHRPTTEDLS